MEDIIGSTAGDVWSLLNSQGPLTTLKLKSTLGIPNSMLYLALGWLAREGKIDMQESGHTYVVSLKGTAK